MTVAESGHETVALAEVEAAAWSILEEIDTDLDEVLPLIVLLIG